jgi:hypothetical protein
MLSKVTNGFKNTLMYCAQNPEDILLGIAGILLLVQAGEIEDYAEMAEQAEEVEPVPITEWSRM